MPLVPSRCPPISTVASHLREFTCADRTKKQLTMLQQWNGTFFEKRRLKDLGLRLQLGHCRGETCLVPEQCHSDDFVVIDITGVHPIGLDFCGCGKGTQSHVKQLLRSCLFPATVSQPRTAATFGLLETFELLSYESKASALEFFQTLDRLTNNTQNPSRKVRQCILLHRSTMISDTSQTRYPIFLRITHQWRHLRMMKRFGWGHDAEGITATKQGECVFLCPACPQPGKNMSLGWENAPEDERCGLSIRQI